MTQDNYFGYFKCPQNIRDISSLPLLQEMKELHCSKIFMDDVGERTNWGLFCKAIENGGTAVLYSFDNALLDGGVDFRTFIKFCAMNEVRIISLGDKVDSEDIMFPPRTSATLLTIANLSAKRNPGRYNDYREDATDALSLKSLKKLVTNQRNRSMISSRNMLSPPIVTFCPERLVFEGRIKSNKILSSLNNKKTKSPPYSRETGQGF